MFFFFFVLSGRVPSFTEFFFVIYRVYRGKKKMTFRDRRRRIASLDLMKSNNNGRI